MHYRFLLVMGMMGLLLSMGGSHKAFAQTDTEFWFVAPTVTKDHGWDSSFMLNMGGKKFYLRFASMSLPAEITVSMPANPAFTPIAFNLPANSAHTVPLTDIIETIWNAPVDQINNRGLRITSTSLITCYFEIGTPLNTDIFSLKGRNALGQEFYVPFQNHFANGDIYASDHQPYSKIDIVATQDNTLVTITPSRPAFPGKPREVPFQVILNRGQTYSVAPDEIHTEPDFGDGQLPENRLTGTRIVADKPIAVTTSDDSVDADPFGSCMDVVGDQIVPVSIVGTEYIVMRGRLGQGNWRAPDMPELFYVTGTQDNTVLYVDGIMEAVIHEGETYPYVVNKQTHHVKTSSPSYMYHVAGFGCEMGGAILPPVNVCTGSTQVSFTRSKGEEFFLNILVRKGAEDGFILNGEGPNTIIPASAFQAVEGTDTWLAAEFRFDEGVIPVAQASLIENIEDVFHLGIINGGDGTGTMYGYFSDFNPHQVTGLIVDSGTDFEAFCYGQPIQLVAHGGVNYRWTPADYLDDPFSQTPIALPDRSMQYVVTASGACGMTESASVTIQVADPLHAMFSVEDAVGCSPFDVTILNQSIGAETYSWNFGNGESSDIDADQFTYTYFNDTDQVQTYTINLKVRNNVYCVDEISTTLKVYPEIKTGVTASATEGCAPLEVSFSGNSELASLFSWDFGDGSSSSDENPVHTFQNFTDQDITYEVVFTAENETGCLVSEVVNITVKPYIMAGFEFDPAAHCNPHELKIFNTAVGATGYSWDFNDGKEMQTFDVDSFYYPFENLTSQSRTFNIKQTVSNASGCTADTTKSFTVYPYLKAAFEPSATEVCSSTEVSFENLSEGAVTYQWQFDGTQGTSSEVSPGVIFTNTSSAPQVHEVVLVATSAEGCTDEVRHQVTVYPELKAEFMVESPETCQPGEIVFRDLSSGAATLVWDFGDGTPPRQEAPGDISHSFPASVDGPVNYTVTLRAENGICESVVERQVTVYPQVEATASAVTSGCHPLEVTFENQSKGAVTYLWDFDDGTTSSEKNPVHTFVNTSPTEVKVYRVKLVAESPTGCKSEDTFSVTVHAKPVAAFELPADAACAPFAVSLVNQSQGQTQSLWYPGDGSEWVNTQNLDHTYYNQETGIVEVYPILYITNDQGCSDTLSQKLTVFPAVQAQVSLSQQAGCHPFTLDITNESQGADSDLPYKWIYGDGVTSVQEEETHSYTFHNPGHVNTATYNLKLVATSAYGCIDSAQVAVEVHPRPRALFSGPDEPSCSPFDVEFEDLSQGSSLSYDWDFGDGAQSHEPGNAIHRFNQPAGADIGWFTTTLHVENQFGCGHSYSQEVGVYPAVVAEFTGQEGCHPLTVQLDNLSEGASSFHWDFADGTTSSEELPGHTFHNAGAEQPRTYQVRLTAGNGFNCYAEAERAVTVYPVPEPEFTMSTNQGCSPMDVTIYNHSKGNLTSLWSIGTEVFENDLSEFVQVFQNLNEEPEDIIMTLEASNQWNCRKTFSQSIKVYPEVTAFYSTDQPMEGCTPLELSFLNYSSNADQYEWTFGDGSFSTEANPSHLFLAKGQEPEEYQVNLKATSLYGCNDQFSLPVKVHPRPVADFIPSPVLQTYPSSTIELTNLSLQGQWEYHWDFGDGHSLVQDENAGPFSHTYVWATDDFATRHYTINLSVESPWCSDAISREVVVVAPEPVAALAAPAQGCPPFEVQFENQSQYGLSYLWDFGDGAISSEASPVHTYIHPGSYRVKLLVSGHNQVKTLFHDITVHQPPVADFRVMNAPPNVSHISIQTVNLSSLAKTYHWDFGDGNQSFEHSPTHLYDNAGTYDITLAVGTDTDPVCYDTLTRPAAITVDDPCVMHFPNAFVPATTGPGDGHYVTGDPLNQVFYPIFKGIEEYRLEIYNRWGELIFRSEELEKGWDGYYQGNLSKMDVYVWKVWARCYNGKEIRQAGDVTLYR